jgi:bifunctional non-homologous end joining protein LigD
VAHDRTIAIDGRRVPISKPGKCLFPAIELTKWDLANYYMRVAGVLLPHTRDRPLALQRFPDGIDSDGFFQKQRAAHYPR